MKFGKNIILIFTTNMRIRYYISYTKFDQSDLIDKHEWKYDNLLYLTIKSCI
jgi:hypothetical protein